MFPKGKARYQCVTHQDEDLASLETTANLSNPKIIESHPCRLALGRFFKVAWLSTLPEVVAADTLDECDGVGGPTTTKSESDNASSIEENGTLRW